MRLGFMGGTFDPVHIGHLECAQRAAEQLSLDEVLFVPAGNPSFKRDRQLAPAEDRLAMCELACASNPLFRVSGMELERSGVTYSIDTVKELLSGMGPEDELYFIVGSDSYLTLPAWRKSEELSSLVTFAVLMRPGDNEALVDQLTAGHGYSAVGVECPKLEISSSYLRDAVKSGRSIRYLVPDPVFRYIEERGLYA